MQFYIPLGTIVNNYSNNAGFFNKTNREEQLVVTLDVRHIIIIIVDIQDQLKFNISV